MAKQYYCLNCGKVFKKYNTIQNVCNYECKKALDKKKGKKPKKRLSPNAA